MTEQPALRRPVLDGAGVRLRPGTEQDVDRLMSVLAEPSVATWWGVDQDRDEVAANLLSTSYAVLLVVEVDGEVAGGIEYAEVDDPQYRSAGIDIYLSGAYQGRGIGTEAVRLLVDYLVRERGHHRLTIDPAVGNVRAIHSYAKVGFRPVGVMREYERGPDGTFHDGLLMDLLASDPRLAP